MTVNFSAAASFLAGHARVLDRRRFALMQGTARAADVLAAVESYRNPDGGYGWGLEADLRAPESQPGGALHALEVFAEVAPVTTPRAAELCDWLTSVSLPGGGLPFAFPVADPTASAPFWTSADPTRFSLQSTAFVAGTALRVAEGDPAAAQHPWTVQATEVCLSAIREITEQPHAIELSFAIRFLDAASGRYPEAGELLARLGRFIPDDGIVPVAGGSAGEVLRPLDFAPVPGPARSLFRPEAVEADLTRLATGQQADGGWQVDFASFSPAAALEWRGYATVGAISVLRANSRLS
ncbi:hypothetical protein [Amycolatopsis jiangsuensis]|uniref:Prenyltransferase/squalene oxidase-like repeat protein n=1 Tax=Amycolatopsis jiangsuensis TaxID=1181879 RepID=A0A840IZV7_9PSEU|nr:hypothetical protein [Amycolatopsis jiangsuensis]MBB4687213.1 hypothetical protein [Amycolatopsis jiangsuensis]